MAPHKPLLLLLALGKLQAKGSSRLAFSEVETRLAGLLRRFSPSGKQAVDVEDPFWRLKNDGVWVVKSTSSSLDTSKSDPPSLRILRASDVSGQLLKHLEDWLKSHPKDLIRVVTEILETNFPESYWSQLLEDTGIDLEMAVTKRDPEFRERILRAYERKCAVTGMTIRLDGLDLGLEAAHIKWKTHGGPCSEANGLALNSLFHTFFDYGAFTLSEESEPRVLVSERVTGDGHFDSLLLSCHGQRVRLPLRREFRPSPVFVQWHQAEVFKKPAREE